MTDRPRIITTIAELRTALDEQRRQGRTIGFVPTMGYLHEGHGSLMAAASAANDVTVASIFVNPLQFAPTEDLASYPRDLERDATLAAGNGVDLLFTPSVDEMYPAGRVLTTVSVAELSAAWDGASRPTHFAGVATVVAKLFGIVGPCRAYFGEKDFQQLAIVTRMVTDLSLPVEVVGCPIVREADGLAMSSRNVYLDPDQRAAAVVLRRALDEGERVIAAGERSTAAVDRAMAAVVAAEPLAALDYAAAVDATTLTQPPELAGAVRLLVAARVGATRLIDNCGVTVDPAGPKGPAS
ncbi:MAG: pantoate--beta-alanine ligase [Acidimicrobiales bacterium]